MNKVKVAKELIKLAKSLVANEIDEQTQTRLDEAKSQGKKYILHHKEGNLWRIMACRDVLLQYGLLVRTGDFGGLIKSEDNLSQEKNCWVDYGAKVTGKANVRDMATVSGNATVELRAQVYDFANITGEATISDNAEIYDNAQVYGRAYVCGNTKVYDRALVYGNALINSDSHIHVNAKIDYDVTEDQEITE